MRPDFSLWRRILILAGPLILSMSGSMVMLFMDGLLLARYSTEAVAAVGPASMAVFTFGSLISGAVGYTSVLTAQYFGAGLPRQIGPAVWQGLRLAVAAGAGGVALAALGRPLFALVGHAPAVQALEARYFSINCLGMTALFLATALAGFFSGLGRTRVVMAVQLSGQFLNIVLDCGLIFGRMGLPEWGVAGAAVATVAGLVLQAVLFAWLFLRREHRQAYGTWSGRRMDPEMMKRMIRFGVPNGFRFFAEMVAWTFFLFFVGRIGATELAATTIAWRINGVAFFPVVGLSEAIRILVGQAQGRGDSETSRRVTWQGLMLAELWMAGTAALFVFRPRQWYGLFMGAAPEGEAVVALGAGLLRYVAAYCLLDAVNIVTCGALTAAGDTRWTLRASVWAHGVFLGALAVADAAGWGLDAEWFLATAFVMALALVWLRRFRSGAWERIRVLDEE